MKTQDTNTGATPTQQPAGGTGATPETVESLIATNAALKARIDELTANNSRLQGIVAQREEGDKQRAADEALIREKMQVGLSRQQAENVIKRQREFDAAKEKADRGEVV